MSVIMTMRLNGDAKKLEELAAGDPDRISSISRDANQYGVIAHRFYADEDGQIMVIDEWPDPESFQRFFEANSERIQPIMQEVGVTAEPEITFWHKLETGDDVGWGA